MNRLFRHVLAGFVGLLLPWLAALTDRLPFLGHATPYEAVLGYMLGGSLLGGVISISLRGADP